MRPTSRLDDCALPSTAKLIGGAFEASKVFGQSVDKTFTAGEIGIRNGIADAALRGVTSSAITQGVAVVTGLQKKFNWAGVAAAGVGQWAGGGLPSLQTDTNITNIASHAGASMASLIASAATRSAIEGSGFGDNIRAGLPDVIGQAMGSALAGGIAGNGRSGGGSSEPENLLAGTPYDGDVLIQQPGAAVAANPVSMDSEQAQKYLAVYPELADILNGQNPASSPHGTVTVEAGTSLDPEGLPIGPVRDVGWSLDRLTLGARHAEYEVNKLDGYDYSGSDFAYEANYWLVGQIEARAAPQIAQVDMVVGGYMALWSLPFSAIAMAEGGGVLAVTANGTATVSVANHASGLPIAIAGGNRLALDYIYNGSSTYIDLAAVGTNLTYGGVSLARSGSSFVAEGGSIEALYQSRYASSYELGLAKVEAQLAAGQPEHLFLANRVDAVARADLKAFALEQGHGTDLVRINQRLYLEGTSGSYRIPDLYFPQSRTIFDGTLGTKSLNTPQIIDFRTAPETRQSGSCVRKVMAVPTGSGNRTIAK